MSFPEAVEHWRYLVETELQRGGYPFPPELILSLIRFESGGKAGVVNPKSKASGLMQVMGVALEDFNRLTGSRFVMADLRGSSIESARKQIQVGLWVLGSFWRGAYNYLKKHMKTVPVDDLAKIGDLFYAAGPGAIRPLLDRLSTPLFEAFVKKYPTHKAGIHAANVWGLSAENKPQWNLPLVDSWVAGSTNGAIAKTPEQGFLLALLVVVVVWFFFGKFSAGKEKKD